MTNRDGCAAGRLGVAVRRTPLRGCRFAPYTLADQPRGNRTALLVRSTTFATVSEPSSSSSRFHSRRVVSGKFRPPLTAGTIV